MIRPTLYLLAALWPALLLGAERLPESAITHIGSFAAPAEVGWGNVGGSLIPCPGTDPTPDDGYPGCMAAYASNNIPTAQGAPHHLYVYDLVPPGGQARTVSGPHDIQDGLQYATLGRIEASQAYDVLYDDSGGECRLWWTWGTWYARISEDPPFLGVSSCDLDNPQPRGMWDLGAEWLGPIEDDPFHTAKGHRGLALIPQSIAAELDGHQLAIAGGFGPGDTRIESGGEPLHPAHRDPGREPGPVCCRPPLVSLPHLRRPLRDPGDVGRSSSLLDSLSPGWR